MAMCSSKAALYRCVTHAPDGRHLRCLIRDSTKRPTGQLPARSAKANESTRLPKPSRSEPCGAAESATKRGRSRAGRRLRHVRAPPSERRRPAMQVLPFQEVDIESSAEITLDAGLTQLSAHEKSRWLLRHESAGPFGGIRARCVVRQGQFQGQFGDSGVPATRSLAYT